MISLDQVLLLERKVENAVAKIAQLNAENAALRSKCAELTNALSAKTEQFSAFQSDQGRIEEGILKALNRLNSVENAILSVSGDDKPPVLQADSPSAENHPLSSDENSSNLSSIESQSNVHPQPEESAPVFEQSLPHSDGETLKNDGVISYPENTLPSNGENLQNPQKIIPQTEEKTLPEQNQQNNQENSSNQPLFDIF